MTSGQKVAFSLLISVLAFCAFTVVAFSGLFDLLEVNFYQPIVQEIKQKKLEEIAAAQNEYFDTLMKRFDAFSVSQVVKTYADPHPSDASAKNREILRSQLVTSTSALTGIRIISENGRNIFFSTFTNDLISGKKGISYRNYDTAGDIKFDFLSSKKLAEGSSPSDEKCRIIKDGKAGRLIFSFPFFNQDNEYSGTILFYCDAGNFSQFLYNRNLVDIKGFATLVTEPDGSSFGGFVFGLPNYGRDSLQGEILKKWHEGGESFWKLNPAENPTREGDSDSVLEKSKNNSLCAFTYKNSREDFGFITLIYDESELKFPPYIRIILLATAFVTLYLAIFLILSFKHDDIVVIRDKVRRYENEFFVGYREMGAGKSPDYLEEQKTVLERRILKSLGKKAEKHAAEFKSIFENYWQEMILAFGENPCPTLAASSAPAINADQLKEIVRSSLEDILENGKIQINALTASSVQLNTRSEEPEVQKNKENPVIEEAPDEVEEVPETEELEEIEEIPEAEEELEEVEEIPEAEEELEDVEEVPEAEEELEEVEEISEAEEELEEVEEVPEAEEELEEVEEIPEAEEELEEVEEIPEAEEELEKVEKIPEAEEELEEIEEVPEAEEELEEVEEIPEAEDELEEVEEVPEAEEELEEVEEIPEAEEELEKAEEIPEAEEELEEVEEVPEAEEELEEVEEIPETEELEEVEEIPEAEEKLEEVKEIPEVEEELEEIEEVPEAEEELEELSGTNTEADASSELEPIPDLNEELRLGDGRVEDDDSEDTNFSTVSEEELAQKFEDELEMLPEVSEHEERAIEIAKTLEALPDQAPRWTDNDDVELDSVGLSRKPSSSEMHDIEKLREVARSIDEMDTGLEELETIDGENGEIDKTEEIEEAPEEKHIDPKEYISQLTANKAEEEDDVYKDEALLEKIEFGVPSSEIFCDESVGSVAENFIAFAMDYSFLDEDDSDDKFYEPDPEHDITKNEHYFENPSLMNKEESAENQDTEFADETTGEIKEVISNESDSLDDAEEVEALEKPEENMPFMFTKLGSSYNTQIAELADMGDAIVQDEDGTFRVTEMPKTDAKISLDLEFKKLVDSILY